MISKMHALKQTEQYNVTTHLPSTTAPVRVVTWMMMSIQDTVLYRKGYFVPREPCTHPGPEL